jgi:hypothetical protein
MKIFLTLFLFTLLSSCAVASLAGTAVSTAAQVIAIPIKVIGKAVTRDKEEEEEEEED